MEFNESTYKVIGKIDKELGDKNAKIKVIALWSVKEELERLTENELKRLFPPNGYVFEPGFFYNYPKFNLEDFISFWVEENIKATPGQDKYRLRFDASEIKSFGVFARNIVGFKQNYGVTNLDTILLQDKEINTKVFYGVTDKYIIGKLKITNGKIEPALNHRIKMWNLSNSNFITTEDKIRLIYEPQENYQILDCMDDKQLFEWFREYFKQIKPDYVNLLDQNASWRTELPKLFSTIDSEKLEADKIRLKRIEEKFDLLKLSGNEIKTLVDSSENLKIFFEKCIQEHKEEFKAIYRQELVQYQSEIEKQKIELNNEIKKLQCQKKSEEESLIKLTESVNETKDELTKIKENKDRIIQDFSIIKEVLQVQYTQNERVKERSNSFIVEEIIHCNSDNITTIEEFEKQLKYQLSNYSINPRFAKKTIDVISLHKAILVKDIRIGVAIAEATNNAKYIIQQVEPDWLHFYDFWNNGLGEIWNSANKSPEILHFLLLEDINMSALECYCRPLLDVLNGIRKRIPLGQTPLPPNLKILATIAPYSEPEIGLPIYKSTFDGWGAIGFRGNIKDKTELIPKPDVKFLHTNFFLDRSIDAFERENIINDVKVELDSIFEV